MWSHLRTLLLPMLLDYVSPLLTREEPGDVQRERYAWEVWRAAALESLPRRYRDLESEQLENMGSMSVRDGYVTATEPQLAQLFSRKVTHIHGHTMNRALEAVKRLCMGFAYPLEPYSLGDVAAGFCRTNLGFPFCSSDPRYCAAALDLARAYDDIRDDSRFTDENPCIVGVRTESAKLYARGKARAVCMVPRVVTIREGAYQEPLFRNHRDDPPFAAWRSRAETDWAVGRLFSTGLPILSADFGGFDKTVPSEILSRIFETFMGEFLDEELVTLRALARWFITSSVITPTGYLTGRFGGIPSGSKFTNLVGSYANLVAMHYAALRLGFRVEDCQVNGDDGLWAFRHNNCKGQVWISVRDLSAVLKEDLGMDLHVEKSTYEVGRAHFLQRLYTDGVTDRWGRPLGYYSIIRCLNHMCGYAALRPAKKWSGYLDTLRWLQQVENCSDDPGHWGLCQWWFGKDRYAGMDVDELIEQAGGLQHVQEMLSTGFSGNGKISPLLFSGSVTAKVLAQIRALGEPGGPDGCDLGCLS